MQYIKNVGTLKLNTELCKGCGLCQIVCPHAVFNIENGKAKIVNADNCMECGACALNCRHGAIKVRSGVGCAAGILNGIMNGTEATCGCSTNSNACC